MGLLSKLAFWKKREPEEFDFDKPPGFGRDLGLQKGEENLGLPGRESGVDTSPTGYLKEGTVWEKEGFEKPAAFEQQGFQQRGFQPNQPFTVSKEKTGDFDFRVSKDFEVISSKLDSLKAALDSVNQRLINVEDMVRREQEEKRKW